MLRGGKTYFSFLKRLQDSGIIDFSLQPARENISIFFVTKKNGRLRMIVDARRSNAHFTEPDHVDLCTGDGLGMLEIGEGETLTIATADLKDAFYHLSLPEELRPLFCLPPVRAGDVGVKQIRGVSISRGMKITPRLAVVPMGWSWALYLCQSIHESLAEQSGLLEKDRLRDRRPPPSTDMAHTQYVDNMIVLGTSEDKVKEAYHLATEKLKSAGLQVHEEEYNKEGAKILGWEFTSDGGFKPSHHRAWKVRMAIRGLLQRGRSSANQMEKIVGHCAFVCLGRREAFSVFGDVYKFIQCHKHSSREVSLWRSVRKELQTFDGIIPLIYRDLRARWNTRVHAVDASEFGLGATVADFPYGFVRELGQYNERWRFRDSQGCNPRQHVLSEQFGDNSVGKQSIVFEDEPDTICQVEGFQNVPFSAVDREWRTVGKHVWWDQASLPVYEARPGLYAAKHALRNRASFGMKHLILTDSLTAACAFSRGRSSGFAMRRVCSQLAALALGTGSTFHFRWIPSEWNPADNPSRGIWSPSSPKRCFEHGNLSPTGPGQPFEMVGIAGYQANEGYQEAEVFAGSSQPHTSSTGRDGGVKCGERDEAEETSKSQGQKTHCQRQWDSDNTRSGLSVEGVSCQIFGTLGGDTVFGDTEVWNPQISEAGGHNHGREAGGPVPGWRGYQHSSVHDCLPHSFPTTVALPRDELAAEDSSEFEGVEQTGAQQISIASSLGGDCFDCHGVIQGESLPFWTAHPAYVHVVPSPFGGFEVESLRCYPPTPGESQGLQSMVNSVAPPRVGDSQQDLGVRRVFATGPSLPFGSGAGHLQVHSGKTDKSEENHIQPHQCRLDGLPRSCGGQAQIGGLGQAPPISFQTWGSLPRFQCKASRPASNTTTREVEVADKCSKVPERCQVEPTVQPVVKRRAKKVQKSKPRHQQSVAKPALSFTSLCGLVAPVFIEIFSGCGLLGKTVAKHNFWPVLLWDITLGPQYDLRSRENRWKILGWMRSGQVTMGHLGTPCNTFSRARDRQPGPPPLRSDIHVMGLPNLRAHDAVKVAEGNLFMRFSVQVMTLAIALGLGFTMENPGRSRIWLVPAVRKLLRSRCISFQLFEMCMFGTPWKKTTGVAAAFVNLTPLANYRCLGARRGCCKRTGLAHSPLAGQDAKGEWRTKSAQAYPLKLCRCLAGCYMSLVAERRAEQFYGRL